MAKKAVYKVALAGHYEVGKTSLFRRIFNLGFCEEKPPSAIESDIHKETFEFEDKNTVIGLEVWDTVDMEKHDSITQSHYRGSLFVLLVYDVTDLTTLQKLRVIAKDVRRYEPIAKLILVRNKIDIAVDANGVTVKQEDDFVNNMEQKIDYRFATSAKDNKGIKEMLRALAKLAFKISKSRGRRNMDQANDGFAHLNLGDRPEHRSGCCS